MSTCLLVIDVQQSFVERPYFSAAGLDAFLEAQNHLISAAAERGLPIVRVLHEEPGDASHPFARASGLLRPMDGLRRFEAAHELTKTRHSALVGTGLDVWLVERGLRRLIVSGIRTEQCCETTARHASDLGWRVRFVSEATMTWPIRERDGGVFEADAIRRRTAAVLHDRFAQVTSVEEALHDAHPDR
jgi:nicotinamidase-related amidase